jgi:hypothetical protein
MMVASAGLQLASGIAQANAQRAQAEQQNKYYNYLADVNEQQALIEEKTGRAQSRAIQDVQMLEGKRLSQSNVKFRASQAARLAASGVPLSSVTADDIYKETMTQQQLDENLLRYNADVRSWEANQGAAISAYGLRTQASGYRTAGRNALAVGRYSARGTLLGSAVSAISPFVFSPFQSSYATAGVGGYGLNTPAGVRNMGTWSKLPGR